MIPVIPDLHIAVFAKPLVPGKVKTRLIPSLGAEGAVRIQRAMLWKTLTVAQAVAGREVSLWVAGDPEHPTLHAYRDAFDIAVWAQQGHDLGARMRSAFAALWRTHRHVLLVGCDCPVLSVEAVHNAAVQLDEGHTDAVFIPVEDGGYVSWMRLPVRWVSLVTGWLEAHPLQLDTPSVSIPAIHPSWV